MRATLAFLILAASLAASGCAQQEAPKAAAITVLDAKPALTSGMGAIEGYVVDETFDPIVGARVHVGGLDRSLKVGADGYYYTGAIKPGSYRLGASADQFRPHTQVAQVRPGEIGLFVFVLRPLPTLNEYQLVKTQRGFLACAFAFAPASNMTQDGSEAGGNLDLQCGLPRIGTGASDRGSSIQQIDASDNSVRRWVLDEPRAFWDSARLETRWAAVHDLARVLRVEAGVEGCTDAARTFASRETASPVVQPIPRAEVQRVLEGAQGTTCTMPGERCDEDSCVLSSRAHPSARPIGVQQVRAGFAFQQAFDQELTATFRPPPLGEVQTLK